MGATPEQELTMLEQQVTLMKQQADAQFALTPIGQQLRQFEIAQRIGQMFAQSTMVPDTYKGNIANCVIAVDMAQRMGANPLMVMQNLYMVHGNPSWSTKFLIATINQCGRFLPLMYESNDLQGDDYGWRCYTYAKDDVQRKNRLEGSWITWKMVKQEKWDYKPDKSGKNTSKWSSMPEQMFKYRAAAFWQRQYAPEISMGFYTREEIEDTFAEDVDYTEIPTTKKTAKAALQELAAKNARAARQAATVMPEPAEVVEEATEAAEVKETIDTNTGEIKFE